VFALLVIMINAGSGSAMKGAKVPSVCCLRVRPSSPPPGPTGPFVFSATTPCTHHCHPRTSGLSFFVPDFELTHLYISPGHNFFGHERDQPSSNPALEMASIWCVAARGIEGDRFFDYKESYKGQITFFEEETYADLCAQLEIWDRPASVFRRNVITRGVRLNDLIGHEFTIGDVRLLGTEESRPCFWMDQAFGPGAQAALKGRGGLRARILTSGRLTVKEPGAGLSVPANAKVISNQ
jgi:MOSC domain-containing protein YiiM